MPNWLSKISVPLDTALPRDRVEVNPAWDASSAGAADPDAAALAIAEGVAAYLGAAREVNVRLYEAATPPLLGAPVGEATKNPGGSLMTSTVPRDVSLCLSYYSGSNIKRRRGRLYLPAQWVIAHTSSSGVAAKPTAGQMTGAGDFATALDLLTTTVGTWCVWSRADNAFFPVTNWYVDDEWDTQRRRGLRPTTRTTGTV